MAQDSIPDQARASDGLSAGEGICIAVAILWVILTSILFYTAPAAEFASEVDDRLRLILMVIAVVLPASMIFLAVVLSRMARAVRSDTYKVQTMIDGLRHMQQAQAAQQPQAAAAPAPQGAPDTTAATSRFSSRREVSRLIVPRAAPQPTADQPTLALEPAAEETAPALERVDYIKALNFPDDENDRAGFSALRRALRDRTARRLVQASQDVLTLLSQDGIYMDDLRPEPVDADLWRQFAAGTRGNKIERLGAIHDRSALALIVARMREDTIFRDAVHHFLRRFDEMVVTFEDQATDTDLLALGETRTARAFMLLARASGTFD